MASLPADMLVQASAELAAVGRYDDAVQILDTLPAGQVTTAARLLRAKILAQQGRFAEAIGHWREVLTAEPDNEEAQRGIAAAQRRADRAGRPVYLPTNLAYASLGAVILCLLLVLSFVWGRHAGFVALEPTLTDQQNQIKVHAEALEFAQATAARSDERAAAVMEFTAATMTAAAQREATDRAVVQTFQQIADQLVAASVEANRRLERVELSLEQASAAATVQEAAADQRLQEIENRIAAADKNLAAYQTAMEKSLGSFQAAVEKDLGDTHTAMEKSFGAFSAAVEKRFSALDANAEQLLKNTLAGNTTINERFVRASEAAAALQANLKSLAEAHQETERQLARIAEEAETRHKTLAAGLNQAVQSLDREAKNTADVAAALRNLSDTLATASGQNTETLRKELQNLRNEMAPCVWLSSRLRHLDDTLKEMISVPTKGD